jgi:hypothetical protein
MYAFVGSKILFIFVPCILNREYIMIYITMFSEAPLHQYFNWCAVSGSVVLDGILYVCLTRWGTSCVSSDVGIVHGHQLCSVEIVFTYMFKDCCCLRYVLNLIVIVQLGCFICLGW